MRAVLHTVLNAMERLDGSLLGDALGTLWMAVLWVAIIFIFYGIGQ